MTITRQTFLLTDTGIHETTTDFSSFTATSTTVNLSLGCVTNDAKYPMFWYGHFDESIPAFWSFNYWKLFDPIAGTPKSYISVITEKYIRATQFDQMTNHAFFLTSFIGVFSDDELLKANGNITRYDQTTRTESTFVIKIKGVVTSIFYALDIKIDPIRRHMWILDSGNNRVLRCNIDTGNVNRIFHPEGMICPCSITIDANSGDAYIRCLNSTLNEESRSSSSSSEQTETFKETIYKANDDEMISIAETSSLVKYDDKWLSPSLEDIENIIASGDDIPLPASDSMKFDHLRNKLWWISKSSECLAFVMDVNISVMNSISLKSNLDTILAINIDRDSGNAIVCGSKDSYGKVIVIDPTTSVITGYQHINSSSVNNIMIIEPEFGNCLPFYGTGYAGQENTDSSASKYADLVDAGTINNSLIAESKPTTTIFTDTPYVSLRIHGMTSQGISSSNVRALKWNKNPDQSIKKAIYTPLFSWSYTVRSNKPAFVAVTSEGDVLKIELDLETNTISTTDQCLQPISSTIEGLSVLDGNSNIYISGGGNISRINLNPTRAGSEANESSSSSSSQSDDDNIHNVSVSQSITDTGVGGLLVQFHNISKEIYCVSKQDCTLISSVGLDDWDSRKTYGPIPNPFKSIWSKQHNGAIVACKHSVHLVQIPNGTIRVVYAVPEYIITDICVMNGKIGISVVSQDGYSGLFKVIDKSFESNLFTYNTSGEYPVACCFLSANIALVALEGTILDVTTTRFVVANLDGTMNESDSTINGQIKSLFLDENYNIAIAVFDSGTTVTISLSDLKLPIVTIVGEIGEQISLAKGSILSEKNEEIDVVDEISSESSQSEESATSSDETEIDSQDVVKKKIRVFVGSSEGTNDRWDSGEIETEDKTILYGGGDNLSPGEAYWVSVSVMHDIYGWSEPTSRLFTVPIM